MKPPIDLEQLKAITEARRFKNGGWFIFRKVNVCAYRSNEFSNQEYETCFKTLNEQADSLQGIVKGLMTDRLFTSSCSLEKVHAMWKP